MEPKRARHGRRTGRWIRMVAFAVLAGAAALTFAYAQSGSGYSLNLNSPVAFPVDI